MVTRIRVVYSAKPKGLQGWPYYDFESEKRVAEIRGILERLQSRLGFEVEFVGDHLIAKPEDIEKVQMALGSEDALLVIALSIPAFGYYKLVSQEDIPVISFIDLFGGFVMPVPKRGIGLSTSDFDEIGQALKVIDTVRRLRETKILYFRDTGGVNEEYIDRAKAKLGVTIQRMNHNDLMEAYQAVEEKQAEEIADRWIEGAEKVVEPSREDIIKSARMYLGLKALMEREGAQAATIDCLGMVYRGLLPAYPCLAFSQLNDEGLTGVCEADLASTLTQLVVGYLGDVPGYVSDPVIDTSTNTVIHCHCVAATKMGGIDAEPEPYYIRSHAEDKQGVSLQVRMRIGQKVTVAKLDGLEQMLISTGEIIGNLDTDRGCRTKAITKVKDARKLLENYSGGLHRVIFYGDLVQPVKWLANILGLEVIEEM